MPASVSGRRKGNRAVRNNKPPSTAGKAPSSLPLSALKEASSTLPSKVHTQPGALENAHSDTQFGPALIKPEKGGASIKPNVFQFLQDGDSSSPSSEETDSDSNDGGDEEAERSQTLAEARPPRDSRDIHSTYPMSPESSFRASSPEQTFSVASRDSVITDPPTSPEGSPATAYLRLANRKNLQKIAQARNRRDGVHQRQSPPPTDDEDDEEQSDDSAPEDYYLNERMHYHQQKQQQQQEQHRSHTTRPHAHRHRKHRDGSEHSTRSKSTSQERGTGQLVRTDTSDKNNKTIKAPTSEPMLTSGYALVASKLDSSVSTGPNNGDRRLVPVYRKFENVNHRILLHLQDEISQLEEELQMMDEYEAKHRAAIAQKDGSEGLQPGSRRMDVEAAGRYSAFHARRLELVDRLAYKVNQYNNALSSYAKLTRVLPNASQQDIQTYRTWMAENTPIAKDETRFLDHDLDLVSLKAPIDGMPAVRGENNNSILYFIIGVLSTALLLPLLAY